MYQYVISRHAYCVINYDPPKTKLVKVEHTGQQQFGMPRRQLRQDEADDKPGRLEMGLVAEPYLLQDAEFAHRYEVEIQLGAMKGIDNDRLAGRGSSRRKG